MSSNIKLSLLALAGAAAAVPHYGGHSRFHKPSGTVPYWGGNATAPGPTGTGGVPDTVTTTYLDETITSTITSTVYLTLSPSPEASAVDVADAETGAAGECGPATVYVTATNKVTVTVPAGGENTPAPEPSSAAPEAPSSPPVYAPVGEPSAPAPEAPASTPAYVPVAEPSSAVPQEQPSSAAPEYTPIPVEEIYSSVSGTPIPAPSSAVPVESSAPPASSAAPSATPSAPSGGYSGGKRGLAYRWDGAADCKSFASKGNFGFAWNWESDSRGDIGNTHFVPTLRTLDNAGDWAEKVEAAISSGSKAVFGFNEPDIATQANLSPAAACEAWKTHMNPIKAKHSGVTVVGPSISSSQDEGKGASWLRSFQESCPDASYDAENFHWYGSASDSFDTFKAYIESVSAEFGKPFWVSEFGLQGASPEQSAEFLKSAQEYLDGKENCEGYSYFAVGNFDPAYNLLGTGDSLTATGEVYVS